MPKILSANRANVLVQGEPVEGLQQIDFRTTKPYTDVVQIGSDERVGLVYGPTKVVGSLRVRSVTDALETLLRDKKPFQIFVSAQGEGSDEVIHEITLDECYLHGKTQVMGAGDVAETQYEFSATRER